MFPGIESRPKPPGAAGVGIPSGAIMDYAGATAPAGWLLCAGQAVSRSTYAALFAAIGTTFGAGDGSTTFNLPDLRGRVAAGVDNMGGSAANRVTSGGSGIAGTTLGASGGAETVTLTTAQLSSHTHGNSFNNTVTSSSGTGAQQTTATGACAPTRYTENQQTGSAGGGGAHQNMPPAMMLNKIIKT